MQHYCKVFELDSLHPLKICPKITKNHIELNSLAKMKVKYATQVICDCRILINLIIDLKLNNIFFNFILLTYVVHLAV